MVVTLWTRCLLSALSLAFVNDVYADVERTNGDGTTTSQTNPDTDSSGGQWVNRAQQDLSAALSESGMLLDRLFGVQQDARAYQQASGSIAPALLWDEFHGTQPQIRFRADLPMPGLNQRFAAFIRRVDPDEYVTERAADSGAFPRQYGPAGEDETLLGMAYHGRVREGGRFEAGAGVRISMPLDPYAKASYVYHLGTAERGLLSLRETAFWQKSGQLGLTSRVDIGRLFGQRSAVLWTGSGTISQRLPGVRGYSTLMAQRLFPPHRAVAFALELSGDTNAEVPLHDYGANIAYRQRVLREGLVLEIRSNLTWPKEWRRQQRKITPGVGLGFEMFFGSREFLSRPVSF